MAGEGLFCHQCRQRTTKRVFLCTNIMRKRPCTVKICQPCLKNRYPKISEEAAASSDWKCPRCCGECICSVCKAQKGEPPVGRIVLKSEKPSNKETLEESEAIGEDTDQIEDVKGKRKAKAPRQPRRVKVKEEVLEAELPLPTGVPLTTVAGIDLHPQDVGHALQFIEFCDAFQEVLKFSTAEAKSLLGDLMRQEYSSAVRFQAKLLALLQNKKVIESSNKNTWFTALKNCLSKSQLPLRLPADFYSGEVDGYDSLDFSLKLRVLTFLCDEALETASLRNHIESKEDVISNSKKEAKQRFAAVKDKELRLKRQLKDEAAVTKTITAGDNAASTLDRESIVSRLKSEAAEAHAELLEAEVLKLKWKQHSDSFRTDPYLFDADGRAFWKLKGYNDGDYLLLQDMGTHDPFVSSDEKWFLYGAETKQAAEKFCSFIRTRSLLTPTLSQILPSSSGSKDEEMSESTSSRTNEEDMLRSIAEDIIATVQKTIFDL